MNLEEFFRNFNLCFRLERLMTKLDDATARMEALTAQMGKIKGEVQTLIDEVKAGGAGNTTPAFDAALDALTASIGGVDDMNPDAAPTPTP